MHENPQPDIQGQPDDQRKQMALSVMDVLLRHLETAKEIQNRSSATLTAPDQAQDRFCLLAYARPGTLCPLGYWEPGQ